MRKTTNRGRVLLVLSIIGLVVAVVRIWALISFSEVDPTSGIPISFETLIRIAFWVTVELMLIMLFFVNKKKEQTEIDDDIGNKRDRKAKCLAACVIILVLIAPYHKMINVYNSNLNIFHGPLKIIVKNNY